MELKEYKVMYDIEENYWWYVGLRNLVFSFINKINSKNEKLNILDAGCGTGKILENFNAYKAYGIDFSEEALRFCNFRNLNNTLRASICDLPFKNNSFDIVTSFDVLCCIDVDYDMKILEELYRIMNKNGVLFLNLPAYNFLQSTHDKAVHIKHRYLLNEVKRKIERAGFIVEKITYRNCFLFPLAFIVRIFKKIFMLKKLGVKSDLISLPGPLNKLLASILFFENKLIISGVNFPFGLSLYCVVRKTK